MVNPAVRELTGSEVLGMSVAEVQEAVWVELVVMVAKSHRFELISGQGEVGWVFPQMPIRHQGAKMDKLALLV